MSDHGVQRRGRFALAIALLSAFSGCGRAREDRVPTAAVARGPLRVWTAYSGKIEAPRVHTILSALGGQATLVEVAPDGARVRAGEIVARFDATRIEREIVRLEGLRAAARSEFEMLVNADWPLKIGDLERQWTEARAREAEEEQFLTDARELRDEGLVGAQEVRQQEIKLDAARARARQLEQQLRLTREYLQPLGIAQAKAKLDAAERELELARQERRACDIAAPADGIVGHLPTHIGGEFRTVRVGDTLYLNQPFLIIPDLSRLVVQLAIPENELGRVPHGAAARVVPVAFPETALAATVASVGATAQNVPGKPAWQRFFLITLELRESDPRLRPGMSVTALVLSHENESALLVPRAAVRWRDGMPFVRTRAANGAVEDRAVTLGWGDERHFEALDGVREGERLIME